MIVSLSNVTCGGRTLRFNPILTLVYTWDKEKNEHYFHNGFLNIDIFSSSYEFLMNDLSDLLFLLWDEYACEKNENLTPQAIRLKENMLFLATCD